MPIFPPLTTGLNRPAKRRQNDGSVRCMSRYEKQAHAQGFCAVAGVDEVGRGALFGPVFAAAVILHPEKRIPGLRDSKLVEATDRSRLADAIIKRSIAWSIGAADAFEIDQINIYQASRLAMKRAVQALSVAADYLLVDALILDLPLPQTALINGDARCQAIAAASLVAKVHRDRCIEQWHEVFPAYNLKSNKGYGSPKHHRGLREHGPTSLHRFSFAPVREASTSEFWTAYSSQVNQIPVAAKASTDDRPLLNFANASS